MKRNMTTLPQIKLRVCASSSGRKVNVAASSL